MTLRAPFSTQHLLEIRLCFCVYSRQARLIADFYHRTFVSPDRANKVAPVHTKSPRGFLFFPSAEKCPLFSFLFPPSSTSAPCSDGFILTAPSVICIVLIFLSSLLYFPSLSTFNLISCSHFPPFPLLSSGHCHRAIDVDVEQIERLARGQEMEEDGGQVGRREASGE